MEKKGNPFSLKRNFFSIIGKNVESSRATPLDGLRVLACLYIIVYHTLGFQTIVTGFETPLIIASYYNFGFRLLYNGTLGVDIFFILSGFLIMKILTKDILQNEKINYRGILYFYARRLLRICPSAYAIMLMFTLILQSLNSPVTNTLADNCKYNFWWNLIFINNFFPMEQQCMGAGWSVAVEMQCYLISPIFVITTIKSRKAGYLLLSLVSLASMALYSGFMAYWYLGYADSYFGSNVVYQLMPFRLFAYTLGMIVCLRVDDDQKKEIYKNYVKIPLRIAFSLGTIGACFMLSPATTFTDNSKYLQACFCRPIFVICMSYVMYDLLSPRTDDSYRKIISKILGNKVMFFYSNLTYSIYLCSSIPMFFIFSYFLTSVEGFVFDPSWMSFVGGLIVFFASSVIALVLYFVIEKPAINIGSDYLRPTKKEYEILLETFTSNENKV